MPQHSSDQGIKQSSHTTAPPTHQLHEPAHHADKAKASIQDFQSKGPQMTDNLPPAATKEELQARARELNK